MAAEVEVVEVVAANAFLPNLTISVEKDDEDDVKEVKDEEMEEEESNIEDKASDGECGSKSEVKVKLDKFPRKKLYENKKLAGLGLSFEEAKKKRNERAKRFQSPLLHNNDQEEEEQEDLTLLTEQAERLLSEIEEYNKNIADDRSDEKIRKDCLHLFGVNSMSTDEIFTYFGKMDPTHIEWINDESCNVVWKEDKLAALALLQISEPVKPVLSTNDKVDEKESSDLNDDLDLDINMDIEEEEKQETVDQAETIKSQSLLTYDDKIVNPLRQCKEPFIIAEKKQYLQIRYACMLDRKVLGAARKSKYYVKYGNPHYGGNKGLFSGSYRKRYQMRKAMTELKEMNVWTSYGEEKKSGDDTKTTERSHHKTKMQKSEIEKDDETLMKSSAKDLDGAIPAYSSDEDGEHEYSSMAADKISKELKAIRSMSHNRPGDVTVTTVINDVRKRLGKRKHDRNNDRSDRRDILEKLPTDLRNRLGRKRGENKSSRDEDRNRSPLMTSSSRKIARYSPPPWE